MGNQVPTGQTLTDTSKAQQIGRNTMSYRDVVTGEIKTGFPAYSSSGALLGYVPREPEPEPIKLSKQDQLNQNLAVSEAAYDKQMRATGMEDSPIPVKTYDQLASTPTEELTQAEAAALSKVQYNKQMTDPTGTYQPQGNSVYTPPVEQPQPQTTSTSTKFKDMGPPDILKPKIEVIDGVKYVTMEGSAMTRLVQKFFQAGQFDKEAEQLSNVPPPNVEYAPSGRQVVKYTEPEINRAAAFDVASLKRQDPTLTDVNAYRLLKGGG